MDVASDAIRLWHMVAVAQLVEHLVVVQDVAGSNPVSHPKSVGFELVAKSPPLEEA